MRITRAALAPVLLVGTLAACNVGGDDGGDVIPMDSTPDDRLCSATYSLTGTYVAEAVPDLKDNETNEPTPDGIPDEYGCWPAGTWTFRVTGAPTESNCTTPPTPEEEYRFLTTYDPVGSDMQGIQFAYELQAPALSENYRLKVSSGGGGLCEGVMELYLDGGKKAWYLHPTLNVYGENGPLAGSADYSEYAEPIYP